MEQELAEHKAELNRVKKSLADLVDTSTVEAQEEKRYLRTKETGLITLIAAYMQEKSKLDDLKASPTPPGKV